MKETDLENKLKLAEQAYKESEIRGQLIVPFYVTFFIQKTSGPNVPQNTGYSDCQGTSG
jgi:hypothetical protein